MRRATLIQCPITCVRYPETGLCYNRYRKSVAERFCDFLVIGQTCFWVVINYQHAYRAEPVRLLAQALERGLNAARPLVCADCDRNLHHAISSTIFSRELMVTGRGG